MSTVLIAIVVPIYVCWWRYNCRRVCTIIRICTTVIWGVNSWTLDAISLRWCLVVACDWWGVCERLDPVGVKCKIVEVRHLAECYWALKDTFGIFTSSNCLTRSPCLFAMCFSTNEVALKSFWQVLHRNRPSSSCLMKGSTALVSSLVKWSDGETIEDRTTYSS